MTHFYDCDMAWLSFQQARLARCNFTDCAMDSVNFLLSTLEGCRVGRCQVRNTRCLDQATITQGGATAEEARANRAAFLRAMGLPAPEKQPPRRGRPHGQER